MITFYKSYKSDIVYIEIAITWRYFMSYLMNIKDDIKKFAHVIQNVLKVDVTIVDENFIRVSGTGRYEDLTGSAIGPDTVFARALKSGSSFFIEDPRNCSLCDTCSDKERCTESAEVCCPIIVEGKAIGVLGLVAFEESQREELIFNKKELMEFLNQMTDLISSRVIEGEMLLRNKFLRKQLETTIDTIDEGIIATNKDGLITHCNYSAKRILCIEGKKEAVGEKFDNVLPELSDTIYKRENISNREIIVDRKRGIRGIFTTKAIEYNNSFEGMVIVIKTISDVKRIINHVSTNTLNIYFDDIIGNSRALSEVKDKALKASRGSSTVFIMGESGTGKEMFARSIHSSSNRSDKPFVAINCAAIPETLLESELFGYEEGAFTGAKRGGKIGKFELANGGTIFLDEIGDMPLHLQTKLLRVLQDNRIERVGGQNSIPLDVRVIAATHKDVIKMLKEGEFRQDLFYRLNVIPIIIPPLRERKEDIPTLMMHILKKCNLKLLKSIDDFKDDVYDMFISYSWPGNIRELENVIEYAVNMEAGDIINLKSLPQRLRKDDTVSRKSKIIPVKELEKRAILNALDVLDNNKEAAAIALGISRATFYRKLKEYGI